MVSVQLLQSSKAKDLDQEFARGHAELRELLQELAQTLISGGMTPKLFGELSRCAFVHAAARISQQANGRVNHSRVSALTGLSRADVKRILLNGDAMSPIGRSEKMPIERVLHAWRVDRRFSDSFGNPKRLRVSGTSTSFAILAKLHGGDVPHRAILDELRRIGAVRQEGRDVVLVTTRVLRQRRRTPTLLTVMPALVDGIRLAAASENSREPPSIYRLTIPVSSDLKVANVRERCLSTVATMLNGLEESLGGQVISARSRKTQQRAFFLTVLLGQNNINGSANRPERSAATKRPLNRNTRR
jgi:hypothetical protein